MNCPNCNHPNEDGAQFCRNCGADLHSKGNEKTGLLNFLYIAILFVVGLCSLLITLPDGWNRSKLLYTLITMCWIISNIAILLPALAIKNKPLKITGIILSLIYAAYYIYENIRNCINMFELIDNFY